MRNCLNRRCITQVEKPGFCEPCREMREETLRKAKKAYTKEDCDEILPGTIRRHRFALPHSTR
jgi:hypothetical protein